MWGSEQTDRRKQRKLCELKEVKRYPWDAQVAIICLGIPDLSGFKAVSLFSASLEWKPLLKLIQYQSDKTTHTHNSNWKALPCLAPFKQTVFFQAEIYKAVELLLHESSRWCIRQKIFQLHTPFVPIDAILWGITTGTQDWEPTSQVAVFLSLTTMNSEVLWLRDKW